MSGVTRLTRRWTASVLVAGLTMAATAGQAEVVLRRGIASEPPSLDPHKTIAQSAGPIIQDLFMTLVETGPDLDLIPGAAETWSRRADGLAYTFKLRQGLVWSDGTPLTARDFEYSYRRLVDPETASLYAWFLYPVKNARAINGGARPVEDLGVEALDDLTLVIELEHPVPYFLKLMARLTFSPVPRHAIETLGDDWAKPGQMVSNGPYVLAERVPQSHIKAVKNPLFFEAEQVEIDAVYYYPTADLQTGFNRFRAGELDLTLNFPPDKFDWIKSNMPEALRVVPSLGLFFLSLRLAHPALGDVRVRKALSLAIDREFIANELLRSGVRPAYSLVSPNFTGYAPIDIAEAASSMDERRSMSRELLAQAGYGAANPLSLVYTYDGQDESRKVAIALAGMWRAVGVAIELVDKEFRAVIADRVTGDFEILRDAYIAPLDDPFFVLQTLETRSSANGPGYSNAAYEALLAESNRIDEVARRMAVLAEAERLAIADQPVIPVYFYVWRRLVQPYVKGWKEDANDSTASRYLRIERPE